jgi:hypothetical protein
VVDQYPGALVYEDGKYLRFYGNTLTGGGPRQRGLVSADVLDPHRRAYTATPPRGWDPGARPTVGSGRARVFAYGLVWVGTWERDEIDEPFRLISDDGSVAVVPPGVPWVSILPDIATLTYE